MRNAVNSRDHLAIADAALTCAGTSGIASQVERVIRSAGGVDDTFFLRVRRIVLGAEQSPLGGVLGTGERLTQDDRERGCEPVAAVGKGCVVGIARGGAIEQVSQAKGAASLGAQLVDASRQVREPAIEDAGVVVDENDWSCPDRKGGISRNGSFRDRICAAGEREANWRQIGRAARLSGVDGSADVLGRSHVAQTIIVGRVECRIRADRIEQSIFRTNVRQAHIHVEGTRRGITDKGDDALRDCHIGLVVGPQIGGGHQVVASGSCDVMRQ